MMKVDFFHYKIKEMIGFVNNGLHCRIPTKMRSTREQSFKSRDTFDSSSRNFVQSAIHTIVVRHDGK